MPETSLLNVRNLSVNFRTRAGTVRALNDFDLRVDRGTVQTVIGESGSGKSVLAHTLLGMLPGNVSVVGSAMLNGEDLLSVSAKRLRQLRARELALAPQSPGTALNPVRTIFRTVKEAAAVKGVPRNDQHQRIESVMASLGLDYNEIAHKYPFQLSGGMQQRVTNAMALLGAPALVIADEPTSSLDPVRVDDVSAQLKGLAESGAGVLVITHDLALAEGLGGRTAVLYGGTLVEEQPTASLFVDSQHPYTAALLGALPERGLVPIPGQPPEMTDKNHGCPFAPRCQYAIGICHTTMPVRTVINDTEVRCHVAV